MNSTMGNQRNKREKQPDEKKRVLRFGILSDSAHFSAWQSECLNKMLSLENIKPALLIIPEDPLDKNMNRGGLYRLRHLFWSIYLSIFIKRRSSALHIVNHVDGRNQISTLYCRFIPKGKISQTIDQSDVAKIKKADLDFILSFKEKHICGEILTIVPFGIWAFQFANEEKYEGSPPPGFWEIYNDDKVTGMSLQKLTEELNGGILLKKSFYQTIDSSYGKNLNTILFESTDLPAQVCRDIRNGNTHCFKNPPGLRQARSFDAPTNLQMVFFLMKLFKNFFRKWVRFLLFFDQWNIGIVDQPITVFLTPGVKPPVKWWPAPDRNTFYADPFAVRTEKNIHVLFEEFDYKRAKGHIASGSIQGEGHPEPKSVLNAPFHMSYPFLFEYEKDIYCIPETREAGEVSLYKALKFPDQWEKQTTLIGNFTGVDSTVFKYENAWWLMAAESHDGSSFHKLIVYYAENLMGPWVPHRANPVKVDIGSARPAGTPFIHEGVLYRPAQDCSGIYGGRIILNRVIKLTPAEFEEEKVVEIEPYTDGPYPDGIHTISGVGDMTLVDGVKKVPTIYNLPLIHRRLKNIVSAFISRKSEK